jgi:hypothetical protein
MATAKQIADIKKQANAIQKSLDNSVKSGQIKSSSSNSSSTTSPQLKALSISLATGAPVPKGTRNNSGQDVGGQVLSRPSSTLASDVKPYDGPVQYTGQSYERQQNAGVATGETGFNNGQPAPFQYTPNTTKSDTFYKSLLDSLKPSNEENNVANQQKALDSELRNTNQGQDEMNRNIKDQPIALPFITGQQNAVEERYALARGDIGNRQQTLQAKLANLQARRQSAIDVSREGLKYAENQESRDEKTARQQYEDSLNQSRYNDSQTQQTLDNTYRQSQADKTGKVTSSNRISTNTPTKTSSSVPNGGYDSSQGTNFITAKKPTVLSKVQSMFAPATSTKIQSQLTDEQLRLFMNDFTETQNQAQQSINPESYLEQWKQAAGIGTGGSNSTRSI